MVDADLSGYFDSIPHAELMKSVSRRISDSRVLRLIKMWLEAPVEETDGKGNRHRTTRNKDQGIGSPQGSPISPLLANIYMRRFIKGWKTGGHEKRLEGANRQLCGRLRHLLPRHGRRGHERDADDDVQAEVDGQRAEDAAYAACRKRRLTFWVTPSVGTTTVERASPTWDHVPRRRRSTGYAERSGS